MKSVSILGCGWLGIPLAESMIADGLSVCGSTTSEHKQAVLQSKGIQPYVFTLETDGIVGQHEGFFDADVLIIDIPPRFHFSQKIASLLEPIVTAKIKKVLLVSSISVYDHAQGVLTEADLPEPRSEKSKQLFDAENLLRQNPNFAATVLRFGGLIGADRHPVKYLAGQADLENPDAPVNLIHLQDCIGVIKRILERDIWDETFNAVAPSHPTREQYYTQKAHALNLAPPLFDHSRLSAGKTIVSAKLMHVLGYSFAFPEL